MAAYPRDYQSRYGVLRGVVPEVVDNFMGCAFAKIVARRLPPPYGQNDVLQSYDLPVTGGGGAQNLRSAYRA